MLSLATAKKGFEEVHLRAEKESISNVLGSYAAYTALVLIERDRESIAECRSFAMFFFYRGRVLISCLVATMRTELKSTDDFLAS